MFINIMKLFAYVNRIANVMAVCLGSVAGEAAAYFCMFRIVLVNNEAKATPSV